MLIKSLGIGLGLLLFWVALHTMPVAWFLAILWMAGAVTLALLDPPEYDPRRWLPTDERPTIVEWSQWTAREDEPIVWTLDDERAMAADRDYDEERSE